LFVGLVLLAGCMVGGLLMWDEKNFPRGLGGKSVYRFNAEFERDYKLLEKVGRGEIGIVHKVVRRNDPEGK